MESVFHLAQLHHIIVCKVHMYSNYVFVLCVQRASLPRSVKKQTPSPRSPPATVEPTYSIPKLPVECEDHQYAIAATATGKVE